MGGCDDEIVHHLQLWLPVPVLVLLSASGSQLATTGSVARSTAGGLGGREAERQRGRDAEMQRQERRTPAEVGSGRER